MCDIHRVVEELCHNDTVTASLPSASRTEIDRLLLSLRDETNELSSLRSQGRRLDQTAVSVNQSYSEKLQDYYRRMKFHEEQQQEENDEIVRQDMRQEVEDKGNHGLRKVKDESQRTAINLEVSPLS